MTGINRQADVTVRDVIGIGFGPGNLGLAVALSEDDHNSPPMDGLFLERRSSFGWHPGMLLPGTNMQISFLKDLVTMRNPRSRFSFVNYLNEHGRLPAFINRQTFTPERAEFADYLSWVAAHVDTDVRYGRNVTAIEHAPANAPAGARFQIRAQGPDSDEMHYARSVVVARGLREYLPPWALERAVAASGRVFHNHRFLDHLAGLPEVADRPRYLVVGGGQSAAEVIAYLHNSGAAVVAAFHGYGLVPSDASPFANQVFDPTAVDDFYAAPDGVRTDLMNRHRYTNYSCVEAELLDDLYAREYRESVAGERRLFFRRATTVTDAQMESNGRVRVTLRDLIHQRTAEEVVDAVVCATGFTSHGLIGISAFGGDISVSRDYRVVVNGAPIHGLFVQGATQLTHGLGSTLLSNIAVRSGELRAAITADLASEYDAPVGVLAEHR